MDHEDGSKSLHKDYSYPKLTMLLCKKARQPPEGHNVAQPAQLIYLNGTIAKANTIGVRVDSIRPGDYYVIYRQDYPSNYKYHKLNLTIQG